MRAAVLFASSASLTLVSIMVAPPATAQDAGKAASVPELLKKVAEATKVVGTPLGDAEKAVQEALDAEVSILADAAAAKKADPTALVNALKKAKAAVADAKTKRDAIDAALKEATKAATPPDVPSKYAVFPFRGDDVVNGTYLVNNQRIGFFAVRFQGTYDVTKLGDAVREGRRVVESGYNLGKQGVLNRLAMKDGDNVYKNIVFGFLVSGAGNQPSYIALALDDVSTQYTVAGGPTINVPTGETQTWTFPVLGIGNVKLTATLREGVAEVVYDLPPGAEQVQLAGEYTGDPISVGAEQFQIYALLVKGPPLNGPLPAAALNTAQAFGDQVVVRRGVTLPRKRLSVRFFQGHHLLLVGRAS